MKEPTRNFIHAMLQGMTGAGLFRRLRYPSQAEVFMGTETAEEHLNSGAFRANCDRFLNRPADTGSGHRA